VLYAWVSPSRASAQLRISSKIPTTAEGAGPFETERLIPFPKPTQIGEGAFGKPPDLLVDKPGNFGRAAVHGMS